MMYSVLSPQIIITNTSKTAILLISVGHLHTRRRVYIECPDVYPVMVSPKTNYVINAQIEGFTKPGSEKLIFLGARNLLGPQIKKLTPASSHYSFDVPLYIDQEASKP